MNLFEDSGINLHYLEELLQSSINDFPNVKDISCDSGFGRDIICFVRGEKGHKFTPEEKAEIESMIMDTTYEAGIFILSAHLRVMFTSH